MCNENDDTPKPQAIDKLANTIVEAIKSEEHVGNINFHKLYLTVKRRLEASDIVIKGT